MEIAFESWVEGVVADRKEIKTSHSISKQTQGTKDDLEPIITSGHSHGFLQFQQLRHKSV